MQLSPAGKLLFHFLFHILVGAVLFAAVALAATMLWYGTELMEEHHVPHLICWICQFVAGLLFFLDVTCLLFLMGVEVWILLRTIWESLRPLGEKNAGS
jgi:hypothetical protein